MGASASSSSKEYVIPETMKRLVLTAPGADLASCQLDVVEIPVPSPGSGEVLIKVTASPINPSDYGVWTRTPLAKCPCSIGLEGCGVVVASGGGVMNSFSVGQKVGFTGLEHGQGAYSEFVVANAMKGTFTYPALVPIEDAASHFVNPYTAVGILTTVRTHPGVTSFVHTAAASQLGQMMNRLVLEDGDLTILNVVRREEQAVLLRALGATHVVVTGGNDSWKKELKVMMEEFNTTVAFDAIAGEMSGDLLGLLPRKGSLYVYGGLGGPVTGVNPIDLIYHAKNLNGWLLPRWLSSGNMLLNVVPRIRAATARVGCGLAAGGWSSSQFVDTTLDAAHADFVALRDGGLTGKKLRIRFDAATAEEKKEEEGGEEEDGAAAAAGAGAAPEDAAAAPQAEEEEAAAAAAEE